MFEYLILLLAPIGERNKVNYFNIAKFDTDPGLIKDEEFMINGVFGSDQKYYFKVKVIKKEKEVVPKRKITTRSANGISVNESPAIFRVRIIVEAEDRDLIVRICNELEKNVEEWKNFTIDW